MNSDETVILKRNVEASVIPAGTKVTLAEGETAHITQSLGGTYTVVVNGNMFRIEAADSDALGLTPAERPAISTAALDGPIDAAKLEKEVWDQMRTCYDPEIPVNIVDLGLIYDCKIEPVPGAQNSFRLNVKMTLTAPGCGMGPVLQQDVQSKLLSVEGVDDVNVELVWEPQWNQGMLTEAAKLQLGLM
jgi:probable FeS assembly SUF system protein SufT